MTRTLMTMTMTSLWCRLCRQPQQHLLLLLWNGERWSVARPSQKPRTKPRTKTRTKGKGKGREKERDRRQDRLPVTGRLCMYRHSRRGRRSAKSWTWGCLICPKTHGISSLRMPVTGGSSVTRACFRSPLTTPTTAPIRTRVTRMDVIRTDVIRIRVIRTTPVPTGKGEGGTWALQPNHPRFRAEAEADGTMTWALTSLSRCPPSDNDAPISFRTTSTRASLPSRPRPSHGSPSSTTGDTTLQAPTNRCFPAAAPPTRRRLLHHLRLWSEDTRLRFHPSPRSWISGGPRSSTLLPPSSRRHPHPGDCGRHRCARPLLPPSVRYLRSLAPTLEHRRHTLRVRWHRRRRSD